MMADDLKTLYYRKSASPCKNCVDRVVGCHSTCELYSEWSKSETAKKDAILAVKQTEDMKNERRITASIKHKRMERCNGR